MNPISANSYRKLPPGMYTDDVPMPAPDSGLLILNAALLQEYGIAEDWFRGPEGLAVLSGSAVNVANPPLAMAYAGHQFGQRVPLLGDGRAHMLGQMQTRSGPVDVQLKGSGRTTYSRGGDGRATLASVLREYIVSEAMAGLGIPTTRSLAAIATREPVFREQPEPGGVLARTAQSHVRVGTFQYAAGLGADAVRSLADFMLDQHFPAERVGDQPYANLLLAVAKRQAHLVARWMLAGFIHGVMNTDNMSVIGETIDFGPCAFMDEFNADKVFSSIDRNGRYAWANQPGIALWNLSRFAETLLPLLHTDGAVAVQIAEDRLEQFLPEFQATFYAGLRAKLGLGGQPELANSFADRTLMLLGSNAIDMTVFFDALTELAAGGPAQAVLALFADGAEGRQWLTEWEALRTDHALTHQEMRLANPAIIARNHRVEAALHAATMRNDLAPLLRLTEALRNPYRCSPGNIDLKEPPAPEERVTETFCGT